MAARPVSNGLEGTGLLIKTKPPTRPRVSVHAKGNKMSREPFWFYELTYQNTLALVMFFSSAYCPAIVTEFLETRLSLSASTKTVEAQRDGLESTASSRRSL